LPQFYLCPSDNSDDSNISSNSIFFVINTKKDKLTFLNSAEFQKIAPHIAKKSEEKVNWTCTGAKKAVILQPQSGNGRAQQ